MQRQERVAGTAETEDTARLFTAVYFIHYFLLLVKYIQYSKTCLSHHSNTTVPFKRFQLVY